MKCKAFTPNLCAVSIYEGKRNRVETPKNLNLSIENHPFWEPPEYQDIISINYTHLAVSSIRKHKEKQPKYKFKPIAALLPPFSAINHQSHLAFSFSFYSNQNRNFPRLSVHPISSSAFPHLVFLFLK